MNILSIDVGIKNFGYCLFTITNNDTFKITDWNILNLCENIPMCQHKIKDKECGKQSKYTKNNNYYCKLHAKKYQYKLPISDLEESKLKKMNLRTLRKHMELYDISYNLPTTKSELLKNVQNHIDEYYFNSIKRLNANHYDLITLGRNLQDRLNKIVSKYNIDKVIIENQISPIANRMKTLQGMITQYFIMKDVSYIEYISSSNKLKIFQENKKLTYKERKKLGINYCHKIIEEESQFNNWLSLLEKKKKLDDLADCFLQGIYFLKKNNLINLNYKKL